MVYLPSLFEEFCKYFDGKLKWSDRENKPQAWTEAIFSFFKEQKGKPDNAPFKEEKEFMRIDYIWRYDSPSYPTKDIELAIEHENKMERIDTLVNEEVQHLVDIKARNKIGIFYIPQGDEEEFIQKIQNRIKMQSMYSSLEKYLIILAYSTTHRKEKSILVKGFFFDEKGNLTEKKQKIISQVK